MGQLHLQWLIVSKFTETSQFEPRGSVEEPRAIVQTRDSVKEPSATDQTGSLQF